MFPLNIKKYSVSPLYKTVTSLLFGTSKLRDPLGMGNDFILQRVERYSDRLLVSQNLTNLDIFGKLFNNIYHRKGYCVVKEFLTSNVLI